VARQASAKCSSRTDKATLASSGDRTPPTQLAIGACFALQVGVGAAVGCRGCGVSWGDGVADGDLVGADEDFFDEQPQDALAFGDGGGGGLLVEAGEEVFEVVG
jgi:hypothetical protein